MPVIELPWEEEEKVFDEIMEFGPVTYLPGRLAVVNKAHLQFLDEHGIRYRLKDWKEAAAQQKRAEAQRMLVEARRLRAEAQRLQAEAKQMRAEAILPPRAKRHASNGPARPSGSAARSR